MERIDTASAIEFRNKKWKESISPQQKLQNETKATFIILIGFIVGLVGLIYYFDPFPNIVFTIGLILIYLVFAVGIILIFIRKAWVTLLEGIALRQFIEKLD